MEVGNGIYYSELKYSFDSMARIYRDVINYAGKQNDKQEDHDGPISLT